MFTSASFSKTFNPPFFSQSKTLHRVHHLSSSIPLHLIIPSTLPFNMSFKPANPPPVQTPSPTKKPKYNPLKAAWSPAKRIKRYKFQTEDLPPSSYSVPALKRQLGIDESTWVKIQETVHSFCFLAYNRSPSCVMK
jgi:hypothetical protein